MSKTCEGNCEILGTNYQLEALFFETLATKKQLKVIFKIYIILPMINFHNQKLVSLFKLKLLWLMQENLH